MFVDVWLTNAELFKALLRPNAELYECRIIQRPRLSWCRASLSSKVLAVHFASELRATTERFYAWGRELDREERERLELDMLSEDESDHEQWGP